MECLSYQADFQKDVEAFLKNVFDSFGFRWEPENKDADTRRISEVYQKRGEFWTLWEGDQIVGSIALRVLTDKVGEIKRFYMLPEYRSLGFGNLLLRTALQEAPRFGFEKLRLDTTSRSLAGIHLFRKYGFQEIPRYNDNSQAEFFFEIGLVSKKGYS